MGLIDALFRAAPRLVGAGFAGRNQREQTEYDRAQQERDFQEKVRQRALDEELSRAQSARSEKLAEAQLGEIAAAAAERRARAEGTGAYAPKPATPPAAPRPFHDAKRGLLINPDGTTMRYAGAEGGGGGGGSGGGQDPTGKKPTATEQAKGMLSASALPVFQQMIQTDPDGSNPRFTMKRSKTASLIRGVLPKGLEEPALGITGSLGAESITEDLQAKRAATQFVDSWIRAVSGAAVPEEELQRYLETYTPSAFDPEPVLRDKAKAWVTLKDALESAAGAAAQLKTPEERLQFALSIVAGGGRGVPRSSPNSGTRAEFSPADRWEELVASGMSKEQATAQVRREMQR